MDISKIFAKEKVFTKELVDELAPEHSRTSCVEGESVGNEYFNEFGIPRCTRCALQYRTKNGEWPHGVKLRSVDISFDADSATTRTSVVFDPESRSRTDKAP